MRFGRRSLLVFCALASLPVRTARASQHAVYLQPFHGLRKAELDAVSETVRSFYGVDVRLLPDVGLPASAFYPPRHRYRAERLLTALSRRLDDHLHREDARGDEVDRILGLTHADISTTKDSFPDWGILGLADLDGYAGVISTFRCARRAHSADHALERFRKVAIHELGHTFGLLHCVQSDRCLMRDAGGSALSVDAEDDLCARCRGRLAARGITVGRSPFLRSA